jgi:broad specificity phosphatase PhoE
VSTKKTIYIIRHGETDYNKEGIIQGSGIDSDLNKTGQLQADMFYNYYRHIEFDQIYTSDLKRTKQSVLPFRKAGYSTQPISELNEINWGYFEGLKGDAKNHEVYKSIVNDWKDGLLDRSVEGGESANQMHKRQQLGLQKIMQRHQEQTILICMHGRALRSFLCLLTNIPLNRMDEFKHQNLCLYILKWDQDKFEIVERNSSKHLQQ